MEECTVGFSGKCLGEIGGAGVVDGEGEVGLGFGFIDLRVGGGVDDGCDAVFGYEALAGREIGDIELVSGEE